MIVFMACVFSFGMTAATGYLLMVMIEVYQDAQREAEEYRLDNESERKGKSK
jgi:hypothetical protein